MLFAMIFRRSVPMLRRHCVFLAALAATSPLEAVTATQEILIRGGTVVTSERRFDADVRVRDGTIVEIGTGLAAGAGARVIDATGLRVMPGGVDPHVHLGGRTRDDYRTGSQAALAGGITTISNFAFPAGEQTLAEAIEREAAVIGEQAIADVILHAGITPGTEQAEMTTLGGETGQTSTKIFMVWTTFDAAVPNHMATMAEAGRAGILTMVHCEDWPILAHAIAELTAAERTSLEYFPDSRPVLAEVVACQRAVAMAEATGAPIYAVHVSSAGALRVLQEARDRGLSVFVETRPIYLHFTRERFEGPDRGLYVGQPPLREQADQDALWAGIASGSVHVLATDHVAYRREEKLDPSQTISSHRAGLSNLQVVRPMLYSEGVVRGRISEERFVAVTSTNAARLFGLYPRKGTIAVGSDADIVLWDPNETRTIRDEDMFSGAGFSVYSGWEVTGWPVMTLRRGEVVYENGEVLAGAGSGELLRRGRWRAP
ncbi:amidohydrolase family protein [Candidatus Palauibacter polyketidifaciens]|uniref:amidohydrolase family protein n=2 Tax=Candidatus Palauibacter polyketidifaciens TaxID=3056740 RepID=UPI002877C3A2|nr:amidohydrolase family protein [Candidatus Palauibacter polyketidifaciens]